MAFGVLALAVGIIASIVGVKAFLSAERRKRLMAKYGDPEIVRRIMERMVWQGQTQEMLLDAFGNPLAIDEKVLKTKRKETWKYDQIRRNAYATKIVLENGVVVGWDGKR